MQTMNQALHAAVLNRSITHAEAMARSTDPQELEQMFAKSGMVRVPAGSR